MTEQPTQVKVFEPPEKPEAETRSIEIATTRAAQEVQAAMIVAKNAPKACSSRASSAFGASMWL